MLQNILHVYRTSYGDVHPAVCRSYAQLATALVAVGKTDDAQDALDVSACSMDSLSWDSKRNKKRSIGPREWMDCFGVEKRSTKKRRGRRGRE